MLGAVAVNSLLGNTDSISRLRGKWMEYETEKGKKIKVLAGYHPAYLLRTPAQKSRAWVDLLRLKKDMRENN
jgi:DNA polymerase